MKNILLTGASRGLGLAICEDLLACGCSVYATSRNMSDSLADLQKQYPDSLKFKSADFSNPEQTKSEIFAKDFISNEVVLHAYINNAAQAYDDIITNMNLSKLEGMFKVNVYTPMLLTKYAIRNMILHHTRGSIVHISSISVHTGYKGLAMYASTKGAIEAFSKNIAREWGGRGIRSNAVVAGFMETSMSASLTFEQKEKIYNRTSLKQSTSPKSVAKTVAFLVSDASESITGQNIHVDSGTI